MGGLKRRVLHLVTRESAAPVTAGGDLVVRIGVGEGVAPGSPRHPDDLDTEALLDRILETERLIVW